MEDTNISSDKARQENQVSWSAPPATQATTALQGMVNQGVDYSTPIRNQFARAEQNLSRSYNNPLGGYTTADVKDKALRSQKLDLSQNLGMALSDAAQQNAQGQFSRQATVAGLTAPQMYNSQSAQKWTGGDTLGAITGGLGGILS